MRNQQRQWRMDLCKLLHRRPGGRWLTSPKQVARGIWWWYEAAGGRPRTACPSTPHIPCICWWPLWSVVPLVESLKISICKPRPLTRPHPFKISLRNRLVDRRDLCWDGGTRVPSARMTLINLHLVCLAACMRDHLGSQAVVPQSQGQCLKLRQR